MGKNALNSVDTLAVGAKERSLATKSNEFDLDGDLLASFDDQYKSRESTVTPPPELPSRPAGKKASLRNILNAQKSKVKIPTGVMVKEPRGGGNFPKHHASSTLSRKEEYDEKRKAAARKEEYLSEDSVSDLSDASSGRRGRPVTIKRLQSQHKEKSNLEKNIESIMKTLPPQVASVAAENFISASSDTDAHRENKHSGSVNPVVAEAMTPISTTNATPIFEILHPNDEVTAKPISRSRSRASSVKSEASFKSVSPMKNPGGSSDDDGNEEES